MADYRLKGCAPWGAYVAWYCYAYGDVVVEGGAAGNGPYHATAVC